MFCLSDLFHTTSCFVVLGLDFTCELVICLFVVNDTDTPVCVLGEYEMKVELFNEWGAISLQSKATYSLEWIISSWP